MGLRRDDHTDDGSERRVLLAVVLLFGAVAALAASDLVADFGEGTTFFHVVFEATVILAGLFGLWLGWRRMQNLANAERNAASALVALDATLHRVRAEAEQWRTEARDLLQGLGAAIERQLTRWHLTAAEREIAMLLLKGMSHKEIAVLRSVGEATVRQQSRAIYQKAGVAGRHELAAFFLEDLVVTPRQ